MAMKGSFDEKKLMIKVLEESLKAEGKVFPNPFVGALVLKNGEIIGKGFHNGFGEKHAERNALDKAGQKAFGGKMLVSLEPCNFEGKQGACTKEIIKAGIKELIFLSYDKNPRVRGKGIEELKRNGIKVKQLRDKKMKKVFEEINAPFNKFIVEKKPFVLLKSSLSIDGVISYGNRKKKRISGKKWIGIQQEMRKDVNGVLVGITTVLNDDPLLTYKKNERLNPIRIVLDDELKTPLNAKLLRQKGKTMIFASQKASKTKELKLKRLGRKLKNSEIEVIRIKGKGGRLDLKTVLNKLGKEGVAFLLVEGGQKIFSSFLKEKLYDRIVLGINLKKKLRNKKNALFFAEEEIKEIRLKGNTYRLGEDLIVEG